MFVIVNQKTQKPIRISYTMETKGRDYMSYDVPKFDAEQEDQYNQNQPVLVLPTREMAEAILNNKFDGVETMTKPCFYKEWDSDGEPCVYEVKELVFKTE